MGIYTGHVSRTPPARLELSQNTPCSSGARPDPIGEAEGSGNSQWYPEAQADTEGTRTFYTRSRRAGRIWHSCACRDSGLGADQAGNNRRLGQLPRKRRGHGTASKANRASTLHATTGAEGAGHGNIRG